MAHPDFFQGGRLPTLPPTCRRPCPYLPQYLPHAVNCVRFCFWRCLWLFVWVWTKYSDQEPPNGFGPNSQGRRVWSVARKCLNFKVIGQRLRSPRRKTIFFGPFGGLREVYVWWNVFSFSSISLVLVMGSQRRWSLDLSGSRTQWLIIITFRVSRRRREMYCGHARICVCLSLCLCVCVCLSAAACQHYCTNPPRCNLAEW